MPRSPGEGTTRCPVRGEHLKKLQGARGQGGLKWRGEPMWARYDPPWMPWFLRRNEVWLELE